MPRSYTTLTLDDAKRMLAAAEAKAEDFGLAYNIAVVDAGGHLLAFARQDGALIGSIDLAIDKATTARIFDKKTSDLARLSQPGTPSTASRRRTPAGSSFSAAAFRSR
jgi:uncharacterized protein GlcG (DUF336 family)